MPSELPQTAYQPLYAQVRDMLVQRIDSGQWRPGELIPNEFQLATEYNVSQGTIRKALIALEADKLIDRQQGKGTYVAQHTSENSLFHFFRMVGLNDERLTPTSQALSQTLVRATRDMAARLEIPQGTALHCVTRIRTLLGRPAIHERIYVPRQLMPSLKITLGQVMDDEMYVIYQQIFGVTIAQASERLSAVAATRDQGKLLGVETGTPLLEITRIGRNVGKAAVELRISRCRTDFVRYATEIS